MSAISTVLEPFTTLEITGMMTVALIGALLIIALTFRIISTVTMLRQYEAACEQVALIEARLKEMQEYVQSLEQEFEKDMNELKQQHTKERFDLQQMVFTRNSEILDLQNTLIELSQPSQYERM